MRSDRRIDPDVNLDQEEQLERLTKLAMEAAARATVSIHGYSEGDKGTRSWIVGIGSTLLVAFILGGWTLSNQVASLQAEVTNLKAEVNDLKKLVEPRYRSP